MSASKTGSGEAFDLDRIRRLVELMKEYDLSQVDLRQSGQRIRLRRGVEKTVAFGAPAVELPAAGPAIPVTSGPSASPPPEAEDEANIVYIKSPMVGTFYRAPNPNAEPYVKVGDNVTPESVVCVIEAMKVFNEIPAEVRGRIVAVLVDNEEPVDHGKPLFKIDTSS